MRAVRSSAADAARAWCFMADAIIRYRGGLCTRPPYVRTAETRRRGGHSSGSASPRLRGFVVVAASDGPLEAHAERDLHRAAAGLADPRSDELRAGRRLAEVRALDVTGRDAVRIQRAGGVGRHRLVPRNLLLVVEQVVDLELHPRLDRLPDGHVVGGRQVHHAVALELV